MNLLLMDNITDAGMEKTLSTRGGRTVYQQLVHVHNVRISWLEVCAPDIFKKHSLAERDAAIKEARDAYDGVDPELQHMIAPSDNDFLARVQTYIGSVGLSKA